MFVIDEKTKFKDLFFYLKNNFKISIHFISNNKLNMDSILNDAISISKTKKKPVLSISENTSIYELSSFFKNFKIEFRNKDGIKLLNKLTLNESKDFNPDFKHNALSISSQLDSALLILKKEPSYEDIDWVLRILRKAARNFQNKQEKVLLIEAIINIYENEKKFTITEAKSVFDIFCKIDSDYLEVLEILNNHKNVNTIDLINLINLNKS